MAKKSTAKDKKITKKQDYCGPMWAKNVIIAILMVAIVCVTTALVTQIYGLRQELEDYKQATANCLEPVE